MKSFASSIKRTIAALAIVGMATTAAINSPAADAAAPHISAFTTFNGLVLHVTGSGFGAGHPVQILGINNDNQNLDAYAFLPPTASGKFATTISDVAARCHKQYLTVTAQDVVTGLTSNALQVTMGYLC